VNGFLIPMNVTEGASKVEKLINNPQLRTRMGLEGRKLVETEYTIDRMTDRIMHVYKNIQK
jgi:glycosyltransferase involved in cell wall biosynthesis